jgi:hypothetical protein
MYTQIDLEKPTHKWLNIKAAELEITKQKLLKNIIERFVQVYSELDIDEDISFNISSPGNNYTREIDLLKGNIAIIEEDIIKSIEKKEVENLDVEVSENYIEKLNSKSEQIDPENILPILD